MFLEILAWLIIIGWLAVVILIVTGRKWFLKYFVAATLHIEGNYAKLAEFREKLKERSNGI